MHDRQIMADYENQFNRLTDDIKQIRRELTIGGSGNSKQD